MASNETVIPQVLTLSGTIKGLPKTSVEVTCPSCKIKTKSKVKKEIVTRWQSCVDCFVCWVSCCKKQQCLNETEESNGDFNHYCGHCGCYLGRHDPNYGGLEFCEFTC